MHFFLQQINKSCDLFQIFFFLAHLISLNISRLKLFIQTAPEKVFLKCPKSRCDGWSRNWDYQRELWKECPPNGIFPLLLFHTNIAGNMWRTGCNSHFFFNIKQNDLFKPSKYDYKINYKSLMLYIRIKNKLGKKSEKPGRLLSIILFLLTFVTHRLSGLYNKECKLSKKPYGLAYQCEIVLETTGTIITTKGRASMKAKHNFQNRKNIFHFSSEIKKVLTCILDQQ